MLQLRKTQKELTGMKNDTDSLHCATNTEDKTADSFSQLKIWEGKFGRDYTDRNSMSTSELDAMYMDYYGISRSELNMLFLGGMDRSARILEVGSNTGNQLILLQEAGFTNLYGVEPQDYAVELSKKRSKNINIIKSKVFELPFKDNFFDIVFTSGVLIHIAPSDIQRALVEIHRCSNKYIWGFEYFADEYTKVRYRGYENLLWKTDFASLYLDLFADLKLVKEKRIKYSANENVDTMFLLRTE